MALFERGPQGPAGPPGTPAKTWLSGNGAPDLSIGREGDFYVDLVGKDIYGPKTSVSWGTPIPIGVDPPTGTGFFTVTSGAFDSAALAFPLPLAKGGTGLTAVPGNANEAIINNAGVLGAASNVKMGSGYISVGSGTVHTSALLRFAYAGGSTLVLLGVKDSGGNDRGAVTHGLGDSLTFGNSAMDCTLTSGTNTLTIIGGNSGANFQIGGGTVASAGFFRFAYNGGVSKKIIVVKYSDGTTDKDFLVYGGGNAWTVGNTEQNLTINSLGLSLIANSSTLQAYHNGGFYIYNYGRSTYDLQITNTGFNLKTLPGGKSADRTTIGHRLSLTSGTSVTTSDVTAAATLYLTPHISNQIALYDGTDWWQYESGEVSLNLGTAIGGGAIASGTNYDVFAYWTGSAVALELTAWTNDTTRATALVRQDGVWSKTGALTRRYVGTIRGSASGQTEDSRSKRFVANYYNAVERPMRIIEATSTWTYVTPSSVWRQVRATSSNAFEYVACLDDTMLTVDALEFATSTANSVTSTGIGIDSTTTIPGECICGGQVGANTEMSTLSAHYKGYPGKGYHKINWLESAATAVNTITFYGSGTSALLQPGMSGKIAA